MGPGSTTCSSGMGMDSFTLFLHALTTLQYTSALKDIRMCVTTPRAEVPIPYNNADSFPPLCAVVHRNRGINTRGPVLFSNPSHCGFISTSKGKVN